MKTLLLLRGERVYTDPFVGIMKGVMLGINPSIKFIDISHLIEPQNIIQAYYTLKFSYKYFPSGTIHIAVVDPGVGGKRRPILIESKNYNLEHLSLSYIKEVPSLRSGHALRRRC